MDDNKMASRRQTFKDIFGKRFAGSLSKWGWKINGDVIVQGHDYGVSVRFPATFPNHKKDPGKLILKASWGNRVLFFGGHEDGIASIKMKKHKLGPRAKVTCKFYLFSEDGQDCKLEFPSFVVDLAKFNF